ncbi:MAG: HDOD domain-containing protein [Nitrospirae bacterium]|nr:HDOD domain-containing protein [Nitrospirota bacterium]
MNESLKLYVQKIKKLPTLPVIAQEILTLVGNDLTSVSRIERVVENDPAISAKILSVANSVFFGVKTQTKTLDNAIMRIGFDNLKSIALGISLMTVLQEGKRGKVFDYNRLYNHSVTVGFTARLFSKKLKLDFSDDIMINGMLHDLGYLIMNKFFPDTYRDVMALFEKERSLLDAEKSVLEFTHADIGHWLAENWKLPNSVLDTTLYHHAPSLADRNLKRVAVIHLADYITTRTMLSPTEKDPNYPFDYASLDILNITEKDVSDFEAGMSGDEYAGEFS